MVGKEHRHNFNKDLDTYLSSKERDDFSVPKRSEPQPEPVMTEDQELEDYEGERDSRGIFDRLLNMFGHKPRTPEEQEEVENLEEVYSYQYDALEEKEESLREQEEEIEEKKQGILQRFSQSLSSLFQQREHWSDEDEAVVDEVESEEGHPNAMVLHDMKTLGKITVRLMQEMTPHKRKEFKESPEFLSVKEILRRYKLIR